MNNIPLPSEKVLNHLQSSNCGDDNRVRFCCLGLCVHFFPSLCSRIHRVHISPVSVIQIWISIAEIISWHQVADTVAHERDALRCLPCLLLLYRYCCLPLGSGACTVCRAQYWYLGALIWHHSQLDVLNHCDFSAHIVAAHWHWSQTKRKRKIRKYVLRIVHHLCSGSSGSVIHVHFY